MALLETAVVLVATTSGLEVRRQGALYHSGHFVGVPGGNSIEEESVFVEECKARSNRSL